MCEYVADKGLDIEVKVCAIEDMFVKHGRVDELRRLLGLDRDTILKTAISMYEDREIQEED